MPNEDALRLDFDPMPGDDYPQLADLARSFLGAADAPADVRPGASEGGISLQMSDLIADAGGELVLYGQGELNILADGGFSAGASAAAHVTAGGEDVTGFGFIAFASGTTVYFPADLAVHVVGSDTVV
ncbi:MAG: hypothetical protein KDG89_05875 [Geminicoccaceae bacterium]|nr:hypothetical protein [Geminicoccaceae bacterium]